MPLTVEEKVNIRFHMGYPTQSQLRAMQAGLPTKIQSNWQIDAVLENPLQEETLPLIRNVLFQLEDIMWHDFPEARLEHKAEKLEELTINLKHTAMLNQQYIFWQQRMAQVLCAPVNPDFSGVNAVLGGGGPTNFQIVQ
ncbi:MAG: hypothetical protein E6R03_14065 [Hyphomicrobiaceae bacterium]|nr:MAG: hypothetical protein E6R03_14065 [Hyphomicrobiaceae bacterium]